MDITEMRQLLDSATNEMSEAPRDNALRVWAREQGLDPDELENLIVTKGYSNAAVWQTVSRYGYKGSRPALTRNLKGLRDKARLSAEGDNQ